LLISSLVLCGIDPLNIGWVLSAISLQLKFFDHIILLVLLVIGDSLALVPSSQVRFRFD